MDDNQLLNCEVKLTFLRHAIMVSAAMLRARRRAAGTARRRDARVGGSRDAPSSTSAAAATVSRARAGTGEGRDAAAFVWDAVQRSRRRIGTEVAETWTATERGS